MMVSNGNITGLVERLVESGHVARVAHPTDRRIAFVRLTEAGRAAFADMAAEHAGLGCRRLVGMSAGRGAHAAAPAGAAEGIGPRCIHPGDVA